MTSNLVAGLYTTDDGQIQCALWVDPDTFVTMGFSSPAIGTPNRPQNLRPRKEVFLNADGKLLRLPFPTPIPPWQFSTPVTLRGDPTYQPFAIDAERNFAESP